MDSIDVKNDADTTGRTGTGAVVGGVAGGVAGGALTGALAGGVTGPVGAVVGAVAGAIVGAVAGRNTVDAATEESYWKDSYRTRPYVSNGESFDDYGPAYLNGVNAHTQYPDRAFDEIEPELSRDWTASRGKSSLDWERAKHASRDGWSRVKDSVERAIPGDSDRDGK